MGTNNKFVSPDFNQEHTGYVGFKEEKEISANRGIKLKNKSEYQREEEKRAKLEYEKKFNVNVQKHIENRDDLNSKAIEKTISFIKLSQDKTLPINKTKLQLEVEQSIKENFLQLGIDLNNDESDSSYGTGSIALITVLCKIILNQRDRINQIEFDLEQIKKSSKTQMSNKST